MSPRAARAAGGEPCEPAGKEPLKRPRTVRCTCGRSRTRPRCCPQGAASRPRHQGSASPRCPRTEGWSHALACARQLPLPRPCLGSARTPPADGCRARARTRCRHRRPFRHHTPRQPEGQSGDRPACRRSVRLWSKRARVRIPSLTPLDKPIQVPGAVVLKCEIDAAESLLPELRLAAYGFVASRAGDSRDEGSSGECTGWTERRA